MIVPIPSPTWILVADASQARIFELDGLSGPLEPKPDFDLTAEDTHGFGRDLKSDRPGRAFASGGSERRSAMEPHHDPHQLAKDRFAGKVSERLNHAFQRKDFVQLVMIAPPHFLGSLRHGLNDAVRRVCIAEIDKDLVKADAGTVLQQVKARLSKA